VPVVDVFSGLHAAIGIPAAPRHRDRTGDGHRVEVNLLSLLLSALVNQSAGYVSVGVVHERWATGIRALRSTGCSRSTIPEVTLPVRQIANPIRLRAYVGNLPDCATRLGENG
jgi:hypothetical protein